MHALHQSIFNMRLNLKSNILILGNSEVFYRFVNLSEMTSVREFVEQFKTEENCLDVLVNNAGCAGNLLFYIYFAP